MGLYFGSMSESRADISASVQEFFKATIDTSQGANIALGFLTTMMIKAGGM